MMITVWAGLSMKRKVGRLFFYNNYLKLLIRGKLVITENCCCICVCRRGIDSLTVQYY